MDGLIRCVEVSTFDLFRKPGLTKYSFSKNIDGSADISRLRQTIYTYSLIESTRREVLGHGLNRRYASVERSYKEYGEYYVGNNNAAKY